MKPILLLLLLCCSVQSQDIDQFLPNLESNIYSERMKSREEIKGAILKKDNLDELKRLIKTDNLNAQLRYALEDILYERYKKILKDPPPIWSMPDTYRFEGQKDIALQYYLKRDTVHKFYNHKKYMRDASRDYFQDLILSQNASYYDILKLAVEMKFNWLIEQRAIIDIYRYDYYSCYDIDYKIKVLDTPMPVNTRIRLLQSSLQLVYRGIATGKELDYAVTDHDIELSAHSWD